MQFDDEKVAVLSEEETKAKLKVIDEYSEDSVEYQEALDTLISSNYKLVCKIAKDYRYLVSNQNNRLNFEDLKQTGTIGLMKGIKKFDLSKGAKLSTYAVRWIKEEINKLLYKSADKRIPKYMSDLAKKYTGIKRLYKKKFQREPTDEEYMDELNISKSKLQNIRSAIENSISLNLKVSQDDNTEDELMNLIKNKDIIAKLNKLDKEQIFDIIDDMKSRWSFVIKERYGFIDTEPQKIEVTTGEYKELKATGFEPKTLREVADELGVCRETVRKDEKKAESMLEQKLELFR